MSDTIVTDAYGTVTPTTWEFLKDRRITSSDWSELIAELHNHDAAVATIKEFTAADGTYDSFRALRALDRRSGRA